MNYLINTAFVGALFSLILSSEGCNGNTIPEVEPGSNEEIVVEMFEEINFFYENIATTELGLTYQNPQLVFDNNVNNFTYSPSREKVSIDLDTYFSWSNRIGANNDFILQIIIAHELAHHLQNKMGTIEWVTINKAYMPIEEYNKLIKKIELQADFLAGVWAHFELSHVNQNEFNEESIMEVFDFLDYMGDDHLMEIQTNANPDNFNHGTSSERMHWFMQGLNSGDISLGGSLDDF